jgi:geranylgeranyl diphosphate synthase type II
VKTSFKQYLENQQKKIDKTLREILPPLNTFPEKLHEAMYYPLFAGGKRLRPILMTASCDAVGGESDRYLPVACAIELIHTYSLVHDDLPSMDNDDYRRGQLTAHKKFGEAVAILAGDALLTEAFYIMASFSDDPALFCRMIEELSLAAGSRGMVGGQVFDLALEGKEEVTVDMLEKLHRHKTGALMTASVSIGAMAGKATKQQFESLKVYGQKVGLAFQVTDDILDIEGNQAELGKSVGKDRAAFKKTFPDVIGLAEAKKIQKALIESALESLALFDDRADPLREIARYCIERKK